MQEVTVESEYVPASLFEDENTYNTCSALHRGKVLVLPRGMNSEAKYLHCRYKHEIRFRKSFGPSRVLSIFQELNTPSCGMVSLLN